MQLRQLFSEKTTIGDPVIVRGLVVLPVFNGNGIPEIVSIELLEEALRRESLKITEVSEGGRVPVLKVDNTAGDRPVLLLDGEVVEGGKQNRIINATIIVLAGIVVDIPVSCVEQGRWERASDRFSAGSSVFRAKSRVVHKRGVTMNLQSHADYRSDQGAVWDEVEESLDDVGVRSSTRDFKKAQDGIAPRIEDFVEAIRPLPNQIGAIFFNEKGVIGAETLATSDLFAKALPKVIRSFAWEALSGGDLRDPQLDDIRGWWETVVESPYTTHASPGAGEDIRISAKGLIGSGLVFKRSLIHLSVFPDAQPERERGPSHVDRQSAALRRARLR